MANEKAGASKGGRAKRPTRKGTTRKQPAQKQRDDAAAKRRRTKRAATQARSGASQRDGLFLEACRAHEIEPRALAPVIALADAVRAFRGNTASAGSEAPQRVSRSTLLLALALHSPPVEAALGENVPRFKEILGLPPELNEGGIEPTDAEDFSIGGNIGPVLQLYRERWPDRALDDVGLAWAILESSKTVDVGGVGSRLRRAEIGVDTAIRSLERSMQTFRRSDIRPSRRSSAEEACLGVLEQAEALSTFFQRAEGEFCFAVFGRWGRGKTYLMDRVAKRLESAEYALVRFNGWRYRTTPEVWAYLYETVVEGVVRADESTTALGARLRSLSLTLRAQVLDRGPWPLVAFGLASFFALWPATAAVHFWRWALGTVGFGVVAYLVALSRKGAHVGKRFQARFARRASYRSALGLQAAIGDDLRRIVVGATKRDARTPWMAVLVFLSLALGLTAWYVGLSVGSWPDDGPDRLQVVSLVAPLLVWWTAVVLVLHALSSFKPCRRILLVVDDLDRCETPQMLEIIESIKLLLEEDEVRDRIQAVFLIEESRLRQAIHEKFRADGSATIDGPGEVRLPLPVMIDEHVDKLFLAYFRFVPADPSELAEAAEVFGRRQAEQTLEEHRERLGHDGDPVVLAGYEELLGHGDEQGDVGQEGSSPGGNPATPAPPAETSAPPPVAEAPPPGPPFSRSELDAIKQSITQLAGLPEDHFNWGPRAVRLFLYRYQLVRLLHGNSSDWSPEAAIAAMHQAYEKRHAGDGDGRRPSGDRLHDAVRAVV